MKKILALALALMMMLALAACGGDAPPADSSDPGAAPPPAAAPPAGSSADTDPGDGWYSDTQLEMYGLTGLEQPAGTAVRENKVTNIELTGMTDENYKAWVVDAYDLITDQCGGAYQTGEYDAGFNVVSFKKLAALTTAEVSTDELPSFELVYRIGEATYSLYILYFPVDYNGESAGYAEVRIADVTSIWGDLPFND